MGPTVRDESRNQLSALRPVTLREQWPKRYEPSDRGDVHAALSDAECGVTGDVLRDSRVERQPEVEMQRLKITTDGPIRRGDDEVADDCQRFGSVH
jgi:hypothetical protein